MECILQIDTPQLENRIHFDLFYSSFSLSLVVFLYKKLVQVQYFTQITQFLHAYDGNQNKTLTGTYFLSTSSLPQSAYI